MKLQNKQLSAAIAIALTLMIAATFITALPVTYGRAPFVQAAVSVSPKVAGLGERVLITGWVNPPPVQNYEVYKNYTFVITHPSGTTEIKTIDYSNTDATASFGFVCNEVGTWSVYLIFNGDASHDAATSLVFKWIVQEEPVANTNPEVPLPTGPWWWPINGQNRDWFWISGDWPNAWYDAAGTAWNQYSKAPNTPHVLWASSLAAGGLIGGTEGAYSSQVSAPVIVTGRGRMYYRYGEGVGSALHPVVVCLNQLTGEVIWKRDMPCNTSNPSAGGNIALDFYPRNKGFQEVVTDINQPASLVSTPARDNLWMVGNGIWQIDPYSGNCKYYLSGTMQSSTGKGSGLLIDDNGNLYLTNYPGTNISKWNGATRKTVWTMPNPKSSYTYYQSDLPGSALGQAYLSGDMWVGNTRPIGGDPFGIAFTSINTTSGKMVVNETIMGNGMYVTSGFQGGLTYGYVIVHGVDRYWYCNDMLTGKELWKSEIQSEYPWGSWAEYMSCSGYGMFYYGQYDGNMYALNLTNGKLAWKTFTDNNTDVVSGVNIPWGRQCIADGKLYFLTGEHDVANPWPRGNTLYCLNAFTGELIWKVRGFQDRGSSGGETAGISSGMFYTYNLYDGRLYMFGKGQTTTTVLASPKTIANGANVLIEGTVMDQSPGSPNTPAISDANMEAWTEYMYTQNQVYPMNAKGVTVFLQAMRSDGSIVDITHVTSDSMGHYEYAWTPPTEDTYKVLATFEGSESYWTSSGQTGLSVGAAPPAPAALQAAPDNTPIFAGIIAAVIIAIVIGILNLLVLRKRK